jgi:hypothetical protein
MKKGKCKYCGIEIYSDTKTARVVCDRCKHPHHKGGWLRNKERLSRLNNENKTL